MSHDTDTPNEFRESIHQAITALASREQQLKGLGVACRGMACGTGACFLYLILLYACEVPRGPLTFIAFTFPFIGACIAVSVRGNAAVSSYEAAKEVDDRLGMHDQLASAYDFLRSGREDTLSRMAIRQTAERMQATASVEQPAVLPPQSFWLSLVVLVICIPMHSRLFPPVEGTGLSQATRRELQRGKDSLEGLLALEADITDEGEKMEFERIKKLIQDLNMMSDSATKDEILARLSREIADMDAGGGKDDAISRALDELKKYRERVAMGDLMDEVQQELDKGAEELAVTTSSGQKVEAEAIKTLALVERKELAEQRAKQEALADDLKAVAKEQREKGDADGKNSALENKLAKATEGSQTKLKKGQLSYDALSAAVEDRDIRAMILDAAADRSRSTDAYQEVYSNYERILDSVMFQQRVPSGQELYVKRYFKVIKPK
ncbi:MAG: hypothetical protein O2857_04535 [Planctomycetota bacterium]|nr:hypothetical protein [Planctomycetota bacterium]